MTSDSDEELKALLEVVSRPAKEGEKVRQLNEVEAWLAAVGAKGGKYKFTALQLWLQYLKWSKHKPMKQKQFFIYLKDCLFQYRKETRKAVYYYLDPSSFDVSEDSIKELNMKLREIHRKRILNAKKNL